MLQCDFSFRRVVMSQATKTDQEHSCFTSTAVTPPYATTESLMIRTTNTAEFSLLLELSRLSFKLK